MSTIWKVWKVKHKLRIVSLLCNHIVNQACREIAARTFISFHSTLHLFGEPSILSLGEFSVLVFGESCTLQCSLLQHHCWVEFHDYSQPDVDFFFCWVSPGGEGGVPLTISGDPPRWMWSPIRVRPFTETRRQCRQTSWLLVQNIELLAKEPRRNISRIPRRCLGYTPATAILKRNQVYNLNRPSCFKKGSYLGGSSRKTYKIENPSHWIALWSFPCSQCQTSSCRGGTVTKYKREGSSWHRRWYPGNSSHRTCTVSTKQVSRHCSGKKSKRDDGANTSNTRRVS